MRLSSCNLLNRTKCFGRSREEHFNRWLANRTERHPTQLAEHAHALMLHNKNSRLRICRAVGNSQRFERGGRDEVAKPRHDPSIKRARQPIEATRVQQQEARETDRQLAP